MTGYFYPYLLHQKESDDSIAFWAKTLKSRPEAEFLLSTRLFPRFVINGRNSTDGQTVFLKSLSGKNPAIPKLLLEAGADPNATGKFSSDFLYYATAPDFPAEVIATAIIHGLKVNRRNADGILPLDRLLQKQKHEAAQVLVQAGAQSDLPWSEVIVRLTEEYFDLPDEINDYPHIHYLMIAIYRRLQCDKSVLEPAIMNARTKGMNSIETFLLEIDEYF